MCVCVCVCARVHTSCVYTHVHKASCVHSTTNLNEGWGGEGGLGGWSGEWSRRNTAQQCALTCPPTHSLTGKPTSPEGSSRG